MAYRLHFTLLSLNLSCMWDSQTYTMKFYFLLLICLMSIWFFDQPEESRRMEGSFLPSLTVTYSSIFFFETFFLDLPIPKFQSGYTCLRACCTDHFLSHGLWISLTIILRSQFTSLLYWIQYMFENFLFPLILEVYFGYTIQRGKGIFIMIPTASFLNLTYRRLNKC